MKEEVNNNDENMYIDAIELNWKIKPFKKFLKCNLPPDSD